VAQLLGMFAAISGLAATFHLPQWINEFNFHTRDAYGYGGDLSVFFGMGVGGLVYLVLAWGKVRKEDDAQVELLTQVHLLSA